MIVDLLKNWTLYGGGLQGLDRAFVYLRDMLANPIADGRYPLEGDDIYALVRTYHPGDPGGKRLESHRKYLDLQYMLSGGEDIFWADRDGLRQLGEYDAGKDLVFYEDPSNESRLYLAQDHFAVFHPGDAHKPECARRSQEEVRKIVIKVRVY